MALIVECDAQTRDGKNANMTALAQGIEGFVTAFAAQYCADHGDVLRIMLRADGSEESAQDDAAWSSLVDWMLGH